MAYFYPKTKKGVSRIKKQYGIGKRDSLLTARIWKRKDGYTLKTQRKK